MSSDPGVVDQSTAITELAATPAKPSVVATFRRDTLYYGLAVFADRITGFLLLPILTTGLNKQDFGAWSQIQSSYGFFSTALLLGFMHTVSGLVAGRSTRDVVRVYVGVLGLVLVSNAVLVGSLLLSPDAASRILFGETGYRYVLGAMAWFVCTECFYELVVLAFMRAEGMISVGSLLHALKAILRLGAAWVGVSSGDPLVAILAILGSVNLLLTAYVLVRYVFRHGWASPTELGWGFWRASLGSALSTAATVLLGWANLSLNRFLIVRFDGLHDVAIYSANYSIVSIVALVQMILPFTLLHHVSSKIAEGALDEAREVTAKAVTYYVYGTLPLIAVVTIFYPQLLALLAPTGYDAGMILPLTLMAFFFAFGIEQLLVFSTFASGRRAALRARLIAFASNVVAGVVVIPTFGVTFAAVPLLAASLVIILICSATLRARLGYRFPWTALYGVAGAGVAMSAIGWLLVTRFEVRGWLAIGLASLGLGIIYLIGESLRSSSLTRQIVSDIRVAVRPIGAQKQRGRV